MAKTTTTPDGSNNTPAADSETPQPKVLKEVTPLGLSEEQMKKSNPEAVQKLQDDAAAKAKTESAAALASMKAAFPDDLEFAIEAHAAGMSVDQAKAKRYDDVAAKNKTLAEENAKLKAESEKIPVQFASDDGEGAQASGAPAEAWENEAAKLWDKNENGLQAEFAHTKTTFLAYYKNNGYKL